MTLVTVDTLERLKEIPPLAIGIAAATTLLLFIGLRLLLKKPPSHLIAFSGGSGSVLVSRKSLQELIKQTCLKDENVEAARPVIKISSGIVRTRAQVRLKTPERLRENCERLQLRIAKLLQKSLSFEQIGSIEIIVSSFGPDTTAEPTEEEEKQSEN